MDGKIGFEMSLIVVEAIRGRCASFMVITATVSEIFGGHRQIQSLFVIDLCVVCHLSVLCLSSICALFVIDLRVVCHRSVRCLSSICASFVIDLCVVCHRSACCLSSIHALFVIDLRVVSSRKATHKAPRWRTKLWKVCNVSTEMKSFINN